MKCRRWSKKEKRLNNSLVKRGVLHRDADDGNMNLFKI
jgi:hypothetical protein